MSQHIDNPNPDLVIKCFLGGPRRTGISAVITRYFNHEFDLGGRSYFHELHRTQRDVQGLSVRFLCFDYHCGERFTLPNQNYWKGTNITILVYDVTNQDTFDSLPIFLEKANTLSKPNIPRYLLGLKADPVDEIEKLLDDPTYIPDHDRAAVKHRVVPTSIATTWADTHGFKYFECSSRFDVGVNEFFNGVIEDYVQWHLHQIDPNNTTTDNEHIDVDHESKTKQKEKGKCVIM